MPEELYTKRKYQSILLETLGEFPKLRIMATLSIEGYRI